MSTVRRVWLSVGLATALGALALSVIVTVGPARAARPLGGAAMVNGTGQVASVRP